MKKFRVELIETVTTTYWIEAIDEEDAENRIRENRDDYLINNSESSDLTINTQSEADYFRR